MKTCSKPFVVMFAMGYDLDMSLGLTLTMMLILVTKAKNRAADNTLFFVYLTLFDH